MTLPQATTFFRNATIALGLLFCAAFIGMAAWASSRAEIEAMERLGHSYSTALAAFQAYYAENVAARVGGRVDIRSDYRDHPHAIPIPATVSQELAEQLSVLSGDVAGRAGGAMGNPRLLAVSAFVLGSFGAALGALFIMDGRVRRALDLAAERSAAHAGALKVLEERQFAFDQHAIVSIADRAGRITYANEKFRLISGYTQDELLGANHRIVKSDAQSPEFYQDLWRVVTSGSVWNGEICNRSKDGSRYWVAATIVPFLDQSGRPEQYISIRTDITQRKQVEHGLAQQQAFLQSLTDALGEGVYAVDADGVCSFVNPEGERLLGWARGELQGRRLHDVVHTHYADGRPMALAECPLYQAMRRGEPFRTDAETFRRKDGGAISVSLAAMPLFEDGRVVGQVVAFADISELLRQRRELEQAKDAAEAANRSKSEFLAVMSHEIRTPMNGVIGMTGLLLETPLDDEQRHFAATIRDSAESLLAIINDILDFSKIEAGKMDFECADFEVVRLVESVVEILAPRALAKGVEIAGCVEPTARLVINGDPGRVRQILMNLAGNAVKFTDSGSVSILAAADDGRLRFDVVDTGIGITEEDQSALFAMFSQVDSSATRRHGGAGLGLAISRRLTEMMGGVIGCQSAPGKGSTFWFDIPVNVVRRSSADAPSLMGKRVLVVDDMAVNRELLSKRLTAAGAEIATAADAHHGGSILLEAVAAGRPFDAAPRSVPHSRLLVVEDNQVNQQVAVGLLRRMGHTVDVAADGLAAVQAVRARPYDLVFMDVRMPVLDGLAATARIRALGGPESQVPIVAMTANAMVGDEAACLAGGMNDYVPKPVNGERLAAALARWIACDGPELALASDERERGDDMDSIDDGIGGFAAETEAHPISDQPVLADLVDALGAEDVHRIGVSFFSDAGRRVVAIQADLAAGNAAAAINDAHAVKGASDSLGFMRVRAVAARMEADLREGRVQDGAALADLLGARLEEARAVFEEMGDLSELVGA